ncbi:MAG TPA: hypothetical protein VNY04_08780 [Chthoniobacterales bacterium]|nr:hypothetical protein [Chthoniobacterales bacterium]
MNWHHFHGADGADALQGIASDGHSFVAALIGGGLEGYGPSQPWPAVNWHHFHGAEGADAFQLQGSASGILVRLLTFSPISGRSEN